MDAKPTIDIARPAERIWPVMIDVERWPEWTPTVTSVELLDGRPLRVGSRARIRQPRLPVAVWTVTALEPGRYFEWQSVVPGLKSEAGHRVEATGPQTARVTLTFSWTGWLAPLIRLVYGRLARRYVQTEAESLKRRCESVR
jgi:uncharacterized membrane protein